MLSYEPIAGREIKKPLPFDTQEGLIQLLTRCCRLYQCTVIFRGPFTLLPSLVSATAFSVSACAQI